MVDNIPLQPSSSAAETIEENFKKYSVVALVTVIACFAGWAVVRYVRRQEDLKVGDAWQKFSRYEPNAFRATESAPAFETLDEPLRPWAKLITANKALTGYSDMTEQLNEAKPLYEKLSTEIQGTPAANGLVPDILGVKGVSASIEAYSAWEKANPQLLDNPAPAQMERARFVTELGTFEIAFYPDAAAEHVKNFKQLIRDHFFEKTKFHRVTKSGIWIVQGGDPNTVDGPKEKWGQGTRGDGIPMEVNKLVHVRGAVAMAQPGSGAPGAKKSSGCQFYIVTKGSHSLDGNYTVFGKVISGMDVVDKIASGENEVGTERPANPVMVSKTEIN